MSLITILNIKKNKDKKSQRLKPLNNIQSKPPAKQEA